MEAERHSRPFFIRLGWAALAVAVVSLIVVQVLPIPGEQRWNLSLLLLVYCAIVNGKLHFGLAKLPRNVVVYGSILVDTALLGALDYLIRPTDLSPLFIVIILISATVAGRNAALVAALSACVAQVLTTFGETALSATLVAQLVIRSAVYLTTALLVSELAFSLTERWRAVAGEAEGQRAEVARRRDELEGLYEISQAFASLENEQETFRQVTKRIAHLLDADLCAIARIDDNGTVVRGIPPGYGVEDATIAAFEYSITDQVAALWDLGKSKYLILNDLATLPVPLTQIVSPLNVRHALVARMGRHGRPVGLIFAANRKENGAFQKKDAQLLSILAGQATVALENARLYAVAQDNLQNLTRLYAISSQLATRSDPDAITTRIVKAVAEALNAPYSSVALLSQAGSLYNAAWLGVPVEVRQLGFRENGIAMTVIRSGVPRFIEDVRISKEANPAIREWGIRASACLPIQHGDKRQGVLYVDFSEPHVFTPTEKNMLAIFANQAAIALEDTRLHHFEQRRAKELEAVSRLSGSLAETMELKEMLRVIEREICAAFPLADAGALLIYDPAKDVLVPLAFFGYEHNALPQVALRTDEGVPGLVFQSGKSVLLAGPAAEDTIVKTMRPENQSLLFSTETGTSYPACLMCVPVSPGGERLGTIVIDNFQSSEAFTPEDLHLLEAMADRAALAIRNAQLFAAGMRRATQLDAVAQVARRVASILDLDELLPTVAQLIHTQFGFRYVHLFINDAERGITQFRAGAGSAAEVMAKEEITVRYGRGVVGWVAEHGQALLANNVLQEPRFIEHALLPDTKAELAIPLKAGARVIGLLDVQSEHLNAFESSDVTTLETLAGQIAIAIENALLYGEMQEQARRDSLTQVYNHGYFLQRLGEEVEKSAQTLCPVTLIMMDLDYFKEYNDQYGHVVGDMVLEATVQAIRAHVHRTDLVGRWGGEEFGVALLKTDAATGRLVAERIRSTLRAAHLSTKSGLRITPPTVSQGLATFPDTARDTATLIDLADGALYRAKSRGRDQICAGSE